MNMTTSKMKQIVAHQRQPPLVPRKEFDSCSVQIFPLMHKRDTCSNQFFRSNTMCSICHWLAIFGVFAWNFWQFFVSSLTVDQNLARFLFCIFRRVLTICLLSFVASLCLTNPNVSFTKFLRNWQKTVIWSKKKRGLFPGAQSPLSGAAWA